MKQKVIKVLRFYGITDLFESDAADEIIKIFRPPKNDNKKFNRTAFKLILLDLGADNTHIEDWFKVRIRKKAVFTKTAINKFLNECENNNFPVAKAVKICAEKNWSGFQYEWIKNNISNEKSIATNATEAVNSFFDRPQH